MSKILIVDDTDPSINYSGSWQLLGPINDVSHEFNNTVRRGDSNDQSLTYSFHGSSIAVYGSVDAPATKGLPGVTFQLDNIDPVKINTTVPIANNNDLTAHVVLYQSPNLVDNSDGSPHKLTIQVTSATSNGPYFYFDFFTVAAGKDSVAGNVILDDRDSTISYVPDWIGSGIPTEYLGRTSQSPGKGSTATFSFNGTDVYVYATTDNARFSGQSQIGFELDGKSSGSDFSNPTGTGPIFNNLIFSAQGLKNKNHTVKMTSLNATPWFLDYIVYSTTNSSRIVDTSPNGGGSKTNTGAIAGGVVGGVVFLGAIAFLVFFFLRRRRRAQGITVKEAPASDGRAGNGASSGHNRQFSAGSGTAPPPTPYMVQPNPQPFSIPTPSRGEKDSQRGLLIHHQSQNSQSDTHTSGLGSSSFYGGSSSGGTQSHYGLHPNQQGSGLHPVSEGSPALLSPGTGSIAGSQIPQEVDSGQRFRRASSEISPTVITAPPVYTED